MPYIDLAGLSRFDAAQKDALARDYALLRDMQWTRSEKAGAVSLWPAGGTELKPTVDFLFTETPPASGDKGPENPSTITGVSSVKVTRCGKNLCPLVGIPSNSSVTVAFTDEGEFVFNGTTSSITYVTIFIDANVSIPDYLEKGKTYTFSLYGDASSVVFAFYRYYTANYGGAIFTIAPGESYTQTIPDTKGLLLRFQIPASTVLNNAKFKLQIEEGSSATVFEPYAGTDYTLPLGSTYYGGTLDVATGVMTVTWVAVELNGTETWDAISSYNSTTGIGLARCYPENIGLRKKAALDVTLNSACTHFSYLGNFGGTSISDGTVTTPRFFYTNGTASINGQARFAVPFSDVADFKAWLATQKTAGTPVMLTYKIYEPFTVQLTPTEILSLIQTDKYTPRLNTVYADASAVQVGYVKSPIRDEYELQQAVIAQGGNV